MSSLSILILAPLLLFCFISALVGIWRLKWVYTTAAIGMGLALVIAVVGLCRVLADGELRHFLGGWPPPFGIEYVLDHLSVFMIVIIVFIGLVAVKFLGAVKDPDQVMPLLARALLPPWLAGVLISGAIAAMMSTADSQLLVVTSSISEDLYHRLLRRRADERRLVIISRIATLAVGGVAFVLAQFGGAVYWLVLLFSYFLFNLL